MNRVNRIFWKILAVIGALMALIVMIIFALPMLVSTNWGQQQLLKMINSEIAGSVDAKQMHLSWFGNQELEGIELKDPNGSTIFNIAKVSSKTSLINFFLHGIKQGKIQVVNLNGTLIEDRSGRTNLENALTRQSVYFAVPHQADDKPVTIVLKNVNAMLDMSHMTEQLSLHLNGETQHDQLSGRFEIDASLSGCGLETMFCIGPKNQEGALLPLHDEAEVKLKIKATNFPVALIDQFVFEKAEETRPELVDIVRDALGENLNVSIEQSITSEGILFEMLAESRNLKIDMAGYVESDQLVFHRPGIATLTIKPEVINQLTYANDKPFPLQMQKVAQMDVIIDKLTLPLDLTKRGTDIFNLQDLSLLAHVDINQIDLAGKILSNPLLFRKVMGTIQTETDSQTATLQISGHADHEGGKPLQVKFEATIDKPATLKQLIENVRKQTQIQLDLEDVPLVLLDEYLGLEKVFVRSIGSTATLRAQGSLKEEQADLILSFNADKFVISALQLQAGNKHGAVTQIRDFVFGESSNSFFEEATEIDFRDIYLNIQAKGKQLLVSLLCQTFCKDPSISHKIDALAGRVIDGNLNMRMQQMNGPVQIELQGENGRYSIDAMLADQVLTLNQPAKIELNVTPGLSKAILQEILPILGEVISSDQPLKITIDPKGFAVPFKHFDLEYIEIGHAMMNLGKVRFVDSGEIHSALDFFKSDSRDFMTVWFTPIYFDMHDGAVRFQRFDMLLMNRYPIATWGRVDLARGKVYMTVGMTGQALSNALNLKLDKDFMMQFPLKGAIGEASIDKRKAATRISALVAQNQGGPPGFLIGTFLKIASGTLRDEKPPAPTTNPLPWDV